MKTTWTKGLNPQEKEEVTQEYLSSARFRAKLRDILQDKANEMRAKARSSESYVSANWAYQQADAIGYERAIFEVISLISEKE